MVYEEDIYEFLDLNYKAAVIDGFEPETERLIDDIRFEFEDCQFSDEALAEIIANWLEEEKKR